MPFPTNRFLGVKSPRRWQRIAVTGRGASLAEPRLGAVAARLPSGEVLIAGGYVDGGGSYLWSAELFSPEADTFKQRRRVRRTG
jgi:hypothetical protein